MIFDNIEFSNAEEMEKTESGYLPRRIRKEWRDLISPGIQNNKFGTGIELRFKMPDGACDIILCSEKVAEARDSGGSQSLRLFDFETGHEPVELLPGNRFYL